MKKNCFNFKKAMTSVMMLSMVSFTMTSCQDFWDDVFGTEDAPVEDTTTPSDPKEEDQVTIAFTENGAELTVQSLSDVTKLLAPDSVKADIEKKAGEEYIIEIKGEGLTTTSEDNTISVPKVEGSNINLTFSDGITTEEPLVVTAAECKSETSVEAVDAITITVPASDGLKLEIDMPETSVTLAAESGTVTFDEVISTTATNALYIESGVTVKNLQVEDGIVVVKEGGKAETYVYAANDEETVLRNDELGIVPTSVQDASGRWRYSVETENGSAYLFHNVKIIKGTADYATIGFYNYNDYYKNTIEKLTIAEGVVVKSESNSPYASVIEGEGEGAQLIIATDGAYTDIRNGKNFAEAGGSLYYVTEMKGIALSVELGDNAKEKFAAADSTQYYLNNAPSNLENCTFKFDYISFDFYNLDETPTSSSVKNCKFEASNESNLVYISVPAQSTTRPSYKFTFADCTFSEGFKLESNINIDWDYVYDENGNRKIVHEFWYYWDDNGNYYEFESKEDAPEGIDDLHHYIDYETVGITPKDYYVTIAFNKCKIGSNDLTKDSDFIDFNSGTPDGAYMRYEIDGTTYMKVRDEKNNWFLVEAPKN